jgi:L-asparaginase
MQTLKPSILIIYTGGTIGMIRNENGVFIPFNLENLMSYIPLLKNFDFELSSYSIDKLIDSSNIQPQNWIELVEIIETNYNKYDGFVILHGSDTMSYTASALSFMLEGLTKPVILTGSQLPIGLPRTDARENLIASLEIACQRENEKPLIQEVCIYFENQLFRGNRTHKFNTENFDAFISGNYPQLAKVGVNIKYNKSAIHKPEFQQLVAHKKLDTNIAILKVFPGINHKTIQAIVNIEGLKAIVLETFGSGNVANDKLTTSILENAIKKGITIFNVTQCQTGAVVQGKYETSLQLKNIGVISGKDITTEAAVTKLMFILAKNLTKSELENQLNNSICGEMS